MRLGESAAMLRPSAIRAVAEEGMRMGGVIGLWFGESAWPTPPPIVEAARAALAAGDHFYQPNSGRPALREALADYHRHVHDAALAPERVTVTASGMQGLVLAAQTLVSPGDRVVVVEPLWTNIPEVFRLRGATLASVALAAREGRWTLDLDRLLDVIDEHTRALVVNSPNNPSGWTMTTEEQRVLLAHCRRHGVWIVADDVYARLVVRGDGAPSFLSIAEPEDRLISVNSFSKAWRMTGWRLGWMIAPAALEATLAALTEYNIACVPGFVQAAGLAALGEGEAPIVDLRERLARSRAFSERALTALENVDFVAPDGAFYHFFAVAESGRRAADSLALARRLLRETRVGLAPGSAFGAAGEGYLRLCYAQPLERLEAAFARLAPALAAAG